MNLEGIQKQLQAEGIDGWLFYDHHGRDPIAYRVLGMKVGHVSRRWYYFIPAEGEPRKLAHRIEPRQLDSLPGERTLYSGWQELRDSLRALVGGAKRVAMQYSPEGMIPYVSLVDGGALDLVRSLGVEVMTSASLVQYFEARWTDAQRQMHLEAARLVDETLDEAFELIGKRIQSHGMIAEFAVAEFIRERFAERNLVTDAGPIVGVGPNSGDPHYNPSATRSMEIQPGAFVLIDLWAKLQQPESVFYDITWTGYCGETPPEEVQKVFEVVTGARDRALAHADKAIKEGREVKGFELDDVARGFITENGYGEAFVHRLGHSIGESVHGNGANLDNLETHDDRPLIPRTCFSIEPGVYLPEFGVRSEIDCYVSETGAAATSRVQKEIVRIGG